MKEFFWLYFHALEIISSQYFYAQIGNGAFDSPPSLIWLNHTWDLEEEGLWIVAHALSMVSQAWEEGD